MTRKIKIKATQTIHVNSCPLSSGMLGQLLALGEQGGRQGPPVPACLSARWHFRPPGETYVATNLLHGQSSGCWSSLPSTWATGAASSSGSAGPPAATKSPSSTRMFMLGPDYRELGGHVWAGRVGVFSSPPLHPLQHVLLWVSFGKRGFPLRRADGVLCCTICQSVCLSSAAWGEGRGAWGASCCCRTLAPV